MLQLYFSPMACSLASRIALMEAGIEARYHLIDLWKKRVIEGDGDFFAVSPKGAVPVSSWTMVSGSPKTQPCCNTSPTSGRGSASRRRWATRTAIACRSG